MKKILLVVFLVSMSSLTFGQFAQTEGSYSSQDVKLRIILFDATKGVVAASTSVVQGSCSGEIAGLGRFVGKTLTFAPYVKVGGDRACAITVEFDSTFKHGKIVENANCYQYHGDACAWEGQAVAKEKLTK